MNSAAEERLFSSYVSVPLKRKAKPKALAKRVFLMWAHRNMHPVWSNLSSLAPLALNPRTSSFVGQRGLFLRFLVCPSLGWCQPSWKKEAEKKRLQLRTRSGRAGAWQLPSEGPSSSCRPRSLSRTSSPQGTEAPFLSPNSSIPKKKSKLRSPGHPASFKGVGSEKWDGLSLGPFGSWGAEGCLPRGSICPKKSDLPRWPLPEGTSCL